MDLLIKFLEAKVTALDAVFHYNLEHFCEDLGTSDLIEAYNKVIADLKK